MRKHDCPYLKHGNKCDNNKARLANCIYSNPAKCPILRDSKAWVSIFRFFKRKSKNEGLESQKTPYHQESHNGV